LPKAKSWKNKEVAEGNHRSRFFQHHVAVKSGSLSILRDPTEKGLWAVIVVSIEARNQNQQANSSWLCPCPQR